MQSIHRIAANNREPELEETGFEPRLLAKVRALKELAEAFHRHAWQRFTLTLLLVLLFGLPPWVSVHRDLTAIAAVTAVQDARIDANRRLLAESVRVMRLMEEEAAVRRQQVELLRRELASVERMLDTRERRRGR